MEALASTVASNLGVPQRTFRRLVDEGSVRARRTSSRKAFLDVAERKYLETHLELISALRAALRNERGVRFAVLYGSRARGDESVNSDVDLFVDPVDESPRYLAKLVRRLEDRIGLEVQLVALGDVAEIPSFLEEVHEDGRVLIDRDRQWPGFKALLGHQGQQA